MLRIWRQRAHINPRISFLHHHLRDPKNSLLTFSVRMLQYVHSMLLSLQHPAWEQAALKGNPMTINIPVFVTADGSIPQQGGDFRPVASPRGWRVESHAVRAFTYHRPTTKRQARLISQQMNAERQTLVWSQRMIAWVCRHPSNWSDSSSGLLQRYVGPHSEPHASREQAR
jgi:hypothetical protein